MTSSAGTYDISIREVSPPSAVPENTSLKSHHLPYGKGFVNPWPRFACNAADVPYNMLIDVRFQLENIQPSVINYRSSCVSSPPAASALAYPRLNCLRLLEKPPQKWKPFRPGDKSAICDRREARIPIQSLGIVILRIKGDVARTCVLLCRSAIKTQHP